ncbi:MAG: tail fiber protein [Chitinophagaceae bacterium]
MDGVIGVVTCFAGNFAPKNWTTCDGQTLSIAQNQALFAILGNSFGGDGVTTFNLPDLRGRTPVSPGQSGGSAYALGQKAGSETTTLQANNVPTHTHDPTTMQISLAASSDDGIDPNSNLGFASRFTGAYAPTADTKMLDPNYNAVIQNNAGSQPINICSPYLVVNYIICLNGLFPTKN